MNRINSIFVRLMLGRGLVVLLLAIGTATTNGAQEFDASNIYPDAPAPEVLHLHAIMGAPIQSPRNLKHRWLTVNSMSIAALIAGEAIDSWGTYRNMTHSKWICGNSPAFGGSYDTNVPGQIFSLRDVQTLCGDGPSRQSANWAFDVTQVGYFSEGGCAAQFHLAGDRNYTGVEGWNLANDVGWYLIARHLGRRTDWISKCGSALNFGRGIVHLDLGIGNFIAVARHQNPNTLDLHVPQDSSYTAPRWWGKN